MNLGYSTRGRSQSNASRGSSATLQGYFLILNLEVRPLFLKLFGLILSYSLRGPLPFRLWAPQSKILLEKQNNMSKQRVLCLHGFTSNGSVLAHQVRGITNALSKDFDFLFPDGPHEVDMLKQNPAAKSWTEYVAANSTAGHRAWWFARDADLASNELGGFHGLERSLDYLGDLIQKTGPVHVIWGFSQGACFAGILMSLLSDKLKDHPLSRHLPTHHGMPCAGVFCSGFRARFPQYDSVYAPGIDVPTLHVWGEQDDVVSPERSETLLKVCRDPSILRHVGGHEIPTSEEDQAVIVRFLHEKVRSKNKESL